MRCLILIVFLAGCTKGNFGYGSTADGGDVVDVECFGWCSVQSLSTFGKTTLQRDSLKEIYQVENDQGPVKTVKRRATPQR